MTTIAKEWFVLFITNCCKVRQLPRCCTCARQRTLTDSEGMMVTEYQSLYDEVSTARHSNRAVRARAVNLNRNNAIDLLTMPYF